MIKVAIIDDEIHCIETLAMHLEALDLGVEVVLKASKVEEAFAGLEKRGIDLLFLDVEMPRLNGFELLDQLGEINFAVVFTTAYSQYAVKAFKYRAFHYLMKPIDEEELRQVLQKFASDERTVSAENPGVSGFIDQLKKNNIIQSKIAVPVSEGLEFVKVEEILYAQSQNNYSVLYLFDGEKLLFSKTLKEVEKTLKKHFFIRIHQSYLINPNFMRKYFRNDGGGVLMENGETLPISKKNKEQIMFLFERIAKGGNSL